MNKKRLTDISHCLSSVLSSAHTSESSVIANNPKVPNSVQTQEHIKAILIAKVIQQMDTRQKRKKKMGKGETDNLDLYDPPRF